MAQLYVHQKIASLPRPVMQLAGFHRISLKPRETKTVEFAVTPDTLSMLNVDIHRVVEPGIFELMVVPSLEDARKVLLTVLPKAVGRSH